MEEDKQSKKSVCIHMIRNIGLADKVNDNIKLLKRHLPYHESDHILNMTYNIVCGGTCLEDIERAYFRLKVN